MAYTPLCAPQEPMLASWARTTSRSALQEMLSVASRPGIISFALGLPAPGLFPAEECARAAALALSDSGCSLQYGPPLRQLKAHVVSLMQLRGVVCKEEQVFLTAGAQQGMNLLARLLLEAGGCVMAEDIIYTGFQQIIDQFQPNILAVPSDPETGMDVDAVEALLVSGLRPAFIYSITDGHNPLAVSMSLKKRTRLVHLARRYQVPIIEDDPYGFLYYDSKPEPPMRAMDDQWVFYVGSFSKILAPGLRAGWVIVPETLIPKLSIVKEASDIDTRTFAQHMISAYFDMGLVAGHIETLRREYGLRREVMLRSLHREFPSEARWKKPSCGVFVWVELADEVDTGELLKIAVETEQVAFIPGHAFSLGGGRRAANCMRLNFSNPSPEQIEEGVSRLARVLKRQ